MKNLLLFLFLAFSGSIAAQNNYEIMNSVSFFRNTKLIKGEVKTELSTEDINGSPYLNDEFINGNVYTTSKTMFPDIPLRFNIYNHEIEFKSPDGKISAIDTPEIVEKIEFGEHLVEYIPYKDVKKIKRGFMLLLNKGNAKLYARPRVDFRDAVPPGAYKDAQPAKFIGQATNYYIRVGNEAALLIEKKKDLVDAFPDHQKELTSFIKKNKITHRKEDKLKALVTFYNEL